MPEFIEAYRKIGDPGDRFDIDFWQRQGPEKIFAASLDLIRDAQIMRQGYADKPGLQRTVERFQSQ